MHRKVLFGALSHALQAFEKRLFPMPGGGRQIDRMLARPVVVVERQHADHGFAPTVAFGHRDNCPIMADRHGGDGNIDLRQGSLPGLLLDAGQDDDLFSNVLDVGGPTRRLWFRSRSCCTARTPSCAYLWLS